MIKENETTVREVRSEVVNSLLTSKNVTIHLMGDRIDFLLMIQIYDMVYNAELCIDSDIS